MRWNLSLLSLSIVVVCLGGCPPSDLGIEIPDASREPVDFEIAFNITHATEPLLEAQSVVITSWRQNANTGVVEEGTSIESRYTSAGDQQYAQYVVLRGYNVGDQERIVFHVVSTGATTQGTATVTYQKSQASLTGQISDSVIVYVHDITETQSP